MAGYAFISYSREDQDYVRSLTSYLRAQGVEVWIDSALDYGDRWATVIQERVDNCAVFVPVMSLRSEKSNWVTREILRAEGAGKPFMPLLLDGQPFFGLADMHYEDVTGGGLPTAAYASRLRDLTNGRKTVSTDRANRQRSVSAPPRPSGRSQLTTTFAGDLDIVFGASWSLGLGAVTFAASYFLAPLLISVILTVIALTGVWAFVWFVIPRLHFSTDGLRFTHGRTSMEFAWSDIERMRLGRYNFLLVIPRAGSAALSDPRLRGQFDEKERGFSLCSLRRVQMSPTQLSAVIDLYAPPTVDRQVLER